VDEAVRCYTLLRREEAQVVVAEPKFHKLAARPFLYAVLLTDVARAKGVNAGIAGETQNQRSWLGSSINPLACPAVDTAMCTFRDSDVLAWGLANDGFGSTASFADRPRIGAFGQKQPPEIAAAPVCRQRTHSTVELTIYAPQCRVGGTRPSVGGCIGLAPASASSSILMSAVRL